MCDYSLELVRSRPARAGEKLVVTTFPNTVTRGFASPEEKDVAVCLLPGTELAFDEEVRCEYRSVLGSRRTTAHTVARFREVNQDQPKAHHDALEFPDGRIVLLTRLPEGQCASVLQLPAAHRAASDKPQKHDPVAV